MPSTVLPSNSVTVLPASAVPFTVRVLSLVIRSVVLRPVSSLTMSSVGVAGGAVSTVMVALPALLVLPATSVAVKVKACAPSASVPVLARVQPPWASAVTVPTSTPLL